MARSGQSLGHLLPKHKDKGSLAELSQCTVSQAAHHPHSLSLGCLLYPLLPSHCPFTKDEWRVGMELCPSPPSGAACLCQDVSRHIVMKGVIKVTAGWSVACSSSLPYPCLLLHISAVDVRSQLFVISIQIIFSQEGSLKPTC